MTVVRRLDHVAIVVRSTAEALRFYEEHLGLRVHSSEEIEAPPVRLTYVDTGNAFLQLVEPLDETSSIAGWLSEHGEGLHHVCFGVDDVEQAVTSLSDRARRSCSGTGAAASRASSRRPAATECGSSAPSSGATRTSRPSRGGWANPAQASRAGFGSPA